METLSSNEQAGVERCIRKGCKFVDFSNKTSLENISDNTFTIEAPLHLFTEIRSYNANNFRTKLASYLSKELRDEELEKSVIADACKRNLSLNTALMRNDLVIFKNNQIYIIEWNDEDTHYVKNDYFDLAHRCFSDFLKHQLLSKKEGIVFKQVRLSGTREQKIKKINRILGNILKDGH